jgi:hypothetical protein
MEGGGANAEGGEKVKIVLAISREVCILGV